MAGSRSFALVAIASTLVLLSAVVGAQGRAERLRAPRTLVEVPQGIDAFAQDGSRIAWATGAGQCVRLRNLITGRQTTLVARRRSRCERARNRGARTKVSLAVGNSSALWTVESDAVFDDGNCSADRVLYAASASRPAARPIATDHTDDNPGGCMSPLPLAGDGNLLTYASARRVVELRGGQSRVVSDEGNVHVLALAASTGKVAALKNVSGEEDRDPVWSPQGQRLAFRRDNHDLWEWPYVFTYGSSAIYVADSDGTNARRLSPRLDWDWADVYDSEPVWSPDGNRIAFAERYLDSEAKTWFWRAGVMNADGSGRSLIGGTQPHWSPDGSKIAYSRGSCLSVVGRDGRNSIDLQCYGDGERVLAATWSPDGRRIAYTTMGTTGSGSGVHVINADGSAQSRLTDLPKGIYPNDVVEWSPDGSRIAFATDDNRGQTGQPGPLYAVDADGRGLAVLLDHLDAVVRWSPDGAAIALVAKNDLKVLTIDGGRLRDLATNIAGLPAWSSDGSEIAFGTTTGPVVAVNVESGGVRQLTHPAQSSHVLDVYSATTRQPVRTSVESAAAVAFSRSLAVVLVRKPDAPAFLEVRDLTSGKLQRRIDVSSRLRSLSISGRRIVYVVGKTINLVEAATGHKTVLTTAASTPIGLSLEGNRVAWAENIHGHGRVRALVLSST